MSRFKSKRLLGLLFTTGVLLVAIGLYFGFMIQGEPPADSFESAQENGVKKISIELEKSLETDDQGLSHAVAVIQTTRGKMKFKFYTKDAPQTTHRLVDLIQSGFYNGLVFHRVVPGFVIQGGDPTGTGMGGSGVKINAEFNTRKHVPGTVAMARAQDPNSADSQFYITLGTHPNLDGNYTVFGQLIEGQEVANQIQVGDRMTSVQIEVN